MRLSVSSFIPTILVASSTVHAGILEDAAKAFGQVTSAGGAAASCVAGLDIVTALTKIPTPTGELQSFLVTHTSKQAAENYCALATQVPPTLSATYSQYTSSLSSWYVSVSSELNVKKSACPGAASVTLPALPFCSAGLNGTNSNGPKPNAAAPGASRHLALVFSMAAAVGFVGAVAVVL